MNTIYSVFIFLQILFLMFEYEFKEEKSSMIFLSSRLLEGIYSNIHKGYNSAKNEEIIKKKNFKSEILSKAKNKDVPSQKEKNSKIN